MEVSKWACYTEREILEFLKKGLLTGKDWDFYRANRGKDKRIYCFEMDRYMKHGDLYWVNETTPVPNISLGEF